MKIGLRLATVLALAALLCVAACDRGFPGHGSRDELVRVAAGSQEAPAPPTPGPAPGWAVPCFAPGQLDQHFLKHGAEMGFATEGDYLRAAQALVSGGPGVEIYRR